MRMRIVPVALLCFLGHHPSQVEEIYMRHRFTAHYNHHFTDIVITATLIISQYDAFGLYYEIAAVGFEDNSNLSHLFMSAKFLEFSTGSLVSSERTGTEVHVLLTQTIESCSILDCTSPICLS